MQRTIEILSGTSDYSAADIMQAMSTDLTENLNANLVSFWFFDYSQGEMVCRHSYDTENQLNLKGTTLHKGILPEYFRAVRDNNFIIAPDVRTKKATAELVESYFDPNDIYSLLDYILIKNNMPVGVICVENRGSQRDWSDANLDYLHRVATLAQHHIDLSKAP